MERDKEGAESFIPPNKKKTKNNQGMEQSGDYNVNT